MQGRSARILSLALVWIWALPACASAGPLYDGSPGAPWWEFDTRTPGGILYIQRNGQSICSIGGVFIPRKVTVTEPDGTVTHFSYPSAFHAPTSLNNLNYARGIVRVHVPDLNGLLYVAGEPKPRHGAMQILRTPLMEAGKPFVYQLRAAFRAGDHLLIEERRVPLRAGQTVSITFDGTRAVRAPLPTSGRAEELPTPRVLPGPR